MHHLLQAILFVSTALAAPLQEVPRATAACETDVSKNFRGWNLFDFQYGGSYQFTAPARQAGYGSVRFNVSNTASVAVPYTVPCTAESDILEGFFFGDVAYLCPVQDPSTGPVSFTYDRNSGALALNQTWSCKDQEYTIVYTATGNVTVEPHCMTTFWHDSNWNESSGELYSDRETTCSQTSVHVPVASMSAVS